MKEVVVYATVGLVVAVFLTALIAAIRTYKKRNKKILDYDPEDIDNYY